REWMDWRGPLTEISDRQALAAVGQPLLMKAYADRFADYDLKIAQVLLTREGLENRERYLNARHTLERLLSWGVVPIINENDTVVTEELQFGDNDRLAAAVAGKLQSDLLLLLTDVESVWDRDKNPVRRVDRIDSDLRDAAGGPATARSRGGMKAKLTAVEEAMMMGVTAVIASGKEKGILDRVLDAYPTASDLECEMPESTPGSWFVSASSGLASRKRWILGRRSIRGTLFIDSGARAALQKGENSLLPSGVTEVEGEFRVGDPVTIASQEKETIGQGLANLSSSELRSFRGCNTEEIRKNIGREIGSCVAVHKDDLVLFTGVDASGV
ncbi:MAG: glutamate 5-kinase, partial [Candidatus Omnitrophica bacterium]|nr:glutamate 5-kinase [Candidatus Omnitrophota bacterium]